MNGEKHTAVPLFCDEDYRKALKIVRVRHGFSAVGHMVRDALDKVYGEEIERERVFLRRDAGVPANQKGKKRAKRNPAV